MRPAILGAIASSGVVTATLVPWTPAHAQALHWFDVSQGSAESSSGVEATQGQSVNILANRGSSPMTMTPIGINAAAAVAGNIPARGPNGSELGGYLPVRFSGARPRMATPTSAYVPSARHYVFAICIVRGSGGYPVSHSGVAGASVFSTSGNAVRYGQTPTGSDAYADGQVLLLSVQREYANDLPLTTTTQAARFGGANSTTESVTLGTATTPRLVVGNPFGSDVAIDMDLFALVVVQGSMTEANRHRMEGYLAHRFGSASILPTDHPYRSIAPMVPSSVSTTLDQEVQPYVWGERQTMRGFNTEIQGDNILAGNGGQGSAFERAIPYDLQPSEKTRLASLLQGTYSIRLAAGLYYRGVRTTDPVSGLQTGMGPRLPNQREDIYELINGAGIKGVQWEYWTPAAHWKTSGTTAGTAPLTAGGGYSRATTLESIRLSDPTQYQAQIAAFTDAILADLEDMHAHPTYPIRVVGFGLQNEARGNFDVAYGHCYYDSQVYVDVLKTLVPKIRASAALSTWSESPNRVMVHVESWDGIGGGVQTIIRADATPLSTGLTLQEEIGAWTVHEIEGFAYDYEYVQNNIYSKYLSGTSNPGRKDNYNNEFWWNPPYSGVGSVARSSRFAHTVMTWLTQMHYLASPEYMYIHVGKPSTDSVAEGYAMTQWRIPGDNGAPTTEYAAGLAAGQFAIVDVVYNSVKPFLDHIRPGAKWARSEQSTYSGTKRVGAVVRPDGKLVVFALNATGSTQSMQIGVGATARHFRGLRYSETERDVPLGAGVITNMIETSIEDRTLQVWIEQ